MSMIKDAVETAIIVGAGVGTNQLVWKQADNYLCEDDEKSFWKKLAGVGMTSVCAGIGAELLTVILINSICNKNK